MIHPLYFEFKGYHWVAKKYDDGPLRFLGVTVDRIRCPTDKPLIFTRDRERKPFLQPPPTALSSWAEVGLMTAEEEQDLRRRIAACMTDEPGDGENA
jgi:hypothetical protein